MKVERAFHYREWHRRPMLGKACSIQSICSTGMPTWAESRIWLDCDCDRVGIRKTQWTWLEFAQEISSLVIWHVKAIAVVQCVDNTMSSGSPKVSSVSEVSAWAMAIMFQMFTHEFLLTWTRSRLFFEWLRRRICPLGREQRMRDVLFS